MAVGRITGPLLARNLTRDGIDLSFETDLLYLDVTNGRIGIKTDTPGYTLDVNGDTNILALRVVTTSTLGNLSISSTPASTVLSNSVGDLILSAPTDNRVVIGNDALVQGNIHATGNITAGGSVQLGNLTGTDTLSIYADIVSDITPQTAGQYDLGAPGKEWAEGYINSLVASAIGGKEGQDLDITVDFEPGSVIANYTVVSDIVFPINFDVTFSGSINTISGITYTGTSVLNIPPGSFSSTTTQVYDVDYNLFNGEFGLSLSGFNQTGDTKLIFEVIPPTPSQTNTPTVTTTPTPTVTSTPTVTPTPTVTVSVSRECIDYITDELSNSLLTENENNIISEVNPCVTPTPTRTPTITPTRTPTHTPTQTVTSSITPTKTPTTSVTNTITPTPSVTSTITPTSTKTPTPTPTVTQTITSTNTQTPSVTTTATNTPTSSSSGGIVTNNLFMKLDATNYISGTWSDETGNGNNATVNGATWISDNGGIFDFDGINDTISIPHNSNLSLNTTTQRTIQVWVKFDTLPSLDTEGQPVFGKLSSNFGFDGYYGTLFSNTSNTRVITNGTGIARTTTSTSNPISVNTWYLYTFISQITAIANTTKVYINTTEVSSTAHGSDGYSESNPLYLGFIGTGVSSTYLNGKIGACYFYTKGLNLTEITNNYNVTKSRFGL
jgi:hypothetical protein